MLRVTIYATLLTMRAASAQNDLRDKQGGQNSWRTKQERKNGQGVLRVPLAFSAATKAARQNLMAEMAIRGLDESVAQIEDKR